MTNYSYLFNMAVGKSVLDHHHGKMWLITHSVAVNKHCSSTCNSINWQTSTYIWIIWVHIKLKKKDETLVHIRSFLNQELA